MNLYLDTSCIAKLFIHEEDSERIAGLVREAEILMTSAISYVEMHSAVARRRREKRLTARETKRIIDVFENDWNHYSKVAVNSDVLKTAAKLTQRRKLRALDAVQLSSALYGQRQLEEPIVFVSADKKLEAVAKKESLQILN